MPDETMSRSVIQADLYNMALSACMMVQDGSDGSVSQLWLDDVLVIFTLFGLKTGVWMAGRPQVGTAMQTTDSHELALRLCCDLLLSECETAAETGR